MNILLFGVIGRVGNAITLKVLEKGHHVLALIRNKNKLIIKNENLSVVEGDIYDKNAWDS